MNNDWKEKIYEASAEMKKRDNSIYNNVENGNGEKLMNKSVIWSVSYMWFDNELEMSKW